jgi:hypothetical protein
MSSSASGSQKSWSRYGEVPMTRCPDYPRLDPLKRLICVSSARGNVGREFVKWESKPRQGKDGKVVFVLICLDFDFALWIWELQFAFPFSGFGRMWPFWVDG